MNFRFAKEAGYIENILNFVELCTRRVPQHVRQHVLLNMNENTKYEDLKTYLRRYEVAQRWIQPLLLIFKELEMIMIMVVKLPWTNGCRKCGRLER